MKRGKILNAELSHAISKMGHTDLMIVCDAGFPIPSDAWRIDLAIAQDLPDLQTVLSLINEEMIVEKVSYAAEMGDNNPVLQQKVHNIFATSSFDPIPHETILSEMATKAKVIIRTGAFDPWGNILLYSGVDAPIWFAKEGVATPPEYAEIVARIRGEK